MQSCVSSLSQYQTANTLGQGNTSNTLVFQNTSEAQSAPDNETIIAGTAVTQKKVSEFAKDNNISGLEFMYCIPGSVGGGIRMNSGCFKKEFKDILVSIQLVDFKGTVRSIPADKIDFNYRSIDLPKDLIFLSATFKGKKKIVSK